MHAIKNAFCLPGERINRRVTGFGVYGPDGKVLPDTAINSTTWETQPAPVAHPGKDGSRLFGPALFAGSVDKQFGFVLLNSLGRLWKLDELPPMTTIIYAAKAQARPPGYGVVSAVLRSLGLANPILITENALGFEELHTAPELFGEAVGGTGTGAFYDWIDSRWPPADQPDPAESVYVSRSGMGPNAGRYACEDHLEHLLRAEGYRIFAPEQHSIAEQVATYQRASRLIFAEGSALHLFALVRQPGQISAVIHRRDDLPAIMAAQMQDRAGQPTVGINAVKGLYWPPARGEHLGLSVLDFDVLRDGLKNAGLIAGKDWSVPDEGTVQASLRAGLAPGQHVMTLEEREIWLRQKRQGKR